MVQVSCSKHKHKQNHFLLQDVIVKVTMSSICGSDMHPYAGRGVALDNGITFGHEYTGVIVAIGDQVALCSLSVRIAVSWRVIIHLEECIVHWHL